MAIGTPADNPTGGTVLVTSEMVGAPRRYKVRVTISSEGNFWARVVHYTADGAEKASFLLPITGPLLGPVDLMDIYMGSLEYVSVLVREGLDVTGTVQATAELV